MSAQFLERFKRYTEQPATRPTQAIQNTKGAVPAIPAHKPFDRPPVFKSVFDTPIVPAKPQVNFTDEQSLAIAAEGRLVVVNAFAGTGKTTTGVGYAAARPNSQFLYMAFNKANALEGTQRFPLNTRCRTTHSLAFGAVGRQFGDRVTNTWRALNVRNEMRLGSVRTAAMVQSIMAKFFQSADMDIDGKHTYELETVFRAQERDAAEALAVAKQLWKRMQDPGDRVSIPHDAYLKMWSLTNPQLPYDYIIFDEAQDSNPVTAHVVKNQKRAKVIYLGDRHQSIYAFRGATNAMDGFDAQARQLHLSKTWRFGPRIADLANLLLGEFKGEKVPIVGMGQDARYEPGASVTKLARTNAQLFKDAALLHGKGIHWIGGVESYQIEKLLDAYKLYSNKNDQIGDPFLRNFQSWGEMSAYAEDAKDPETRVLCEVIEEFRHETPKLVGDIRMNALNDPKGAKLILTTAHKSKGLDWDYVEIADDFEILADTEADLAADPMAAIDVQEINLLYVAITRAKKFVRPNSETMEWLKKLPTHRDDRARAQMKMRARQGAAAPK